jgi:hypothetical protein
MGRRARLLVNVLACVGLLAPLGPLGACKPLYGDRPEKLKTPDRKKKPPEPDVEAIPIKYIDECTFNQRDDPKMHRPDPGQAGRLVGDGDVAVQQSGKAKDPASQAELIKVGIDKYRSALIKDNFNHEAIYRLALAYDMVYRKGCALELLKRIQKMQANPKYAKAANRIADEINDNQSLFKGYRKDALAAVGR